jgi:hypothetical protein
MIDNEQDQCKSHYFHSIDMLDVEFESEVYRIEHLIEQELNHAMLTMKQHCCCCR